ncbi:MAG: transcriptional repressor [Candidatus Omnitrophota bacterium]
MNNYLEKLKAGGFKLTPRRQGIISLFVDCETHLTPEDVWSKLKKKFDRCGLPSVYRNLESLVECGILTRIQQSDRKKHYGLCSASHGHHHHHITCIKCGKVDDIKDCAIGTAKKINGYKVVSHFMQVNGVCAGCSKE